MKQATVYGVMVLMSVNVFSAVEVFPICTKSDNQRFPSISGDLVVWQDDRNSSTGLDIYGYSLTSRQEFSISTAAGSQEYPKIGGDLEIGRASCRERV